MHTDPPNLRRLLSLAVLMLLVVAGDVACARAQPQATTPHPPDSVRLIDDAKAAMGRGDYDGAAELLERAEEAAGSEASVVDDVYYYRATLAAYRWDLDAAAEALLARLDEAERRLDDEEAFWLHNRLLMVRTTQGDLAGALAENEERNRFGQRATFEPDGMSLAQLVAMKDLWHRAYILRMMAERRSRTARAALIRYAQQALDAYIEIARPMPKYQDSIAVLEGFFAALDGNAEAAAAAASRVNVAENGDLEDLCLTALAFYAAGRHEDADAVLQRMKEGNSTDIYLARPIMLEWLRRVRSGELSERFTPLNPRGTP